MKKVLIFSTLKSQVNYTESDNITKTEPIHPYLGLLWSNLIKDKNIIVDYLNTTPFLKFKKNNFFKNYILLPKNYSTIIVHSTIGIGKATLIKLFNWRINIIYYSLSKINPKGNFIHVLFRKILFCTDVIFSNHVVYGLNDLKNCFPLICYKKKKTYFPFLTDYNFFQSSINKIDNNILFHNKFILIVGDITRDDFYVYKELSNFNLPVIRITRDQEVIKTVENIMNKNRGDIILSGVSFIELANYYNKAHCCIVASKFDDWQPGGITSIAEALSCNGICISNSGGEIESEFNNISSQNSITNPILFYKYPINGSLSSVIKELNILSNEKIQVLKNRSKLFSKHSLNFNTKGVQLLNHIINQYIK